MREHYCVYKDGMCELDIDEAFQQGIAYAIDECRKILLNDCDCKRDSVVEDETDCVNCMAKRMEKLKEKNNGIL